MKSERIEMSLFSPTTSTSNMEFIPAFRIRLFSHHFWCLW